MKWTDIDTAKQLFLPLLNTTPSQLDTIEIAPSHISIDVDDPFRTIWLSGPKNQESDGLLDAIVILGKTFCKMICAGKGRVQIYEKTDPSDLVTEIDAGIEMLFRIWLKRFFPQHKIIGEEGLKDKISSQDTVWYIDPVDGTSNYVGQNENVGINIGCLKAGKPWVSFVANPLTRFFYYGSADSQSVIKETPLEQIILTRQFSQPIIIGTEFRDINLKSKAHLNHILTQLDATSFQKKSIAVNLLALLEGQTSAFYKNNVKMWDIVAPLILISILYQNDFAFDLYLKEKDWAKVSFFDNSALLLDKLNMFTNSDKKAGLCIIYPAHSPTIGEAILNEYRNP